MSTALNCRQGDTALVCTPHIPDECLRPVRPETVLPLPEQFSLLAQLTKEGPSDDGEERRSGHHRKSNSCGCGRRYADDRDSAGK
jgi:hypothetical protein